VRERERDARTRRVSCIVRYTHSSVYAEDTAFSCVTVFLCVYIFVCVREREREREKEREGQSDRERRQRKKEKEEATEKERERKRERKGKREGGQASERERERERRTHAKGLMYCATHSVICVCSRHGIIVCHRCAIINARPHSAAVAVAGTASVCQSSLRDRRVEMAPDEVPYIRQLFSFF